MDFSTTLLREKFILRDAKGDQPPVIALSNRITVPLSDARGKIVETFVVRSQSMHSCIRLAAKIAQTYAREGPIMVRDKPFNFTEAWDDVTRDYERQFNPDSWASVYNAGKRIFSANEYHAFLDVIENCDHRNNSGSYDTSVFLAEEIFAQKGKAITIDHDANTGMVLDMKKDRARCALILRSPIKRTNFTYIATSNKLAENPFSPVQCLTIAAAFLEGIQLAFLIGRVNEQLRLQIASRYGEEDRKATSARRRLARLDAEISAFEGSFNVGYRPERPEFPAIVVDSEKYTRVKWEQEQAEKYMMEIGEPE